MNSVQSFLFGVFVDPFIPHRIKQKVHESIHNSSEMRTFRLCTRMLDQMAEEDERLEPLRAAIRRSEGEIARLGLEERLSNLEEQKRELLERKALLHGRNRFDGN